MPASAPQTVTTYPEMMPYPLRHRLHFHLIIFVILR